MSPIIFTHKG